MSHRKQLTGRRVVHKSTGGILPSIPEPVDPVRQRGALEIQYGRFREPIRVWHLNLTPLFAGGKPSTLLRQKSGLTRWRCARGGHRLWPHDGAATRLSETCVSTLTA